MIDLIYKLELLMNLTLMKILKNLVLNNTNFKKTNATDKINSTSLVKKSIGGNDFENQNPIPMTPDS